MRESDDDFIHRMKTTFGIPSEQDARRVRQIELDEAMKRIRRRLHGGNQPEPLK